MGRPRLEGPCILAPNHSSYLDPVVLGACLRRRVVFLMTAPIYRIAALRWFFRWVDALPVEEGAFNRRTMQQAMAALERGRVVAIFPEGRISRTGDLLGGRPGVAALVLRAGVPVVPVRILGTFEALPRHRAMVKPATVRVVFGQPIPPSAWEAVAGPDRRTRLRRVTETIMGEIARLGEVDGEAGPGPAPRG